MAIFINLTLKSSYSHYNLSFPPHKAAYCSIEHNDNVTVVNDTNSAYITDLTGEGTKTDEAIYQLYLIHRVRKAGASVLLS